MYIMYLADAFIQIDLHCILILSVVAYIESDLRVCLGFYAQSHRVHIVQSDKQQPYKKIK